MVCDKHSNMPTMYLAFICDSATKKKIICYVHIYSTTEKIESNIKCLDM